MFNQTFCDSPLDFSRKGWTTLLSFGLEAIAVIALITLPLLHMGTLPPLQTVAPIFIPILESAPVEIHPANTEQSIMAPVSEASSRVFQAPARIPLSISNDNSMESAPFVPLGNANPRTALSSIANNGSSVRPLLPTPTRPTRVSQGVMEGALLQKVQPIYPRLAVITHTEGSVVLQAVIGREGDIENLQVISGNPYLAHAALDAVRQWKYRPYRLNNEPVEVETQIVVNFTLGN
jgi:periplasmic protein TonB